MKKNLFFAALALVALASCTDDQFVGSVETPQDNSPSAENAIVFNSSTSAITRADFVGATAAEKLGGMFVVEGTKGSEQTNSPSTTVVFDNYLVGYEYNSAGTTEDNTNNWEYVGLEKGITGRMTGQPTEGNTWAALHPTGSAQVQSVKYWDYSMPQYDFIAWSTGEREAVTDAAESGSKVKVTRINTGTTLATNGFTMTALSAADLMQCYYTDINTVLKVNYGDPVTLTFRNMAAKVRVALYETVPGYSVKEVKFYSADCEENGDPTTPKDLGTGSSADNAVLFTTGGSALPQSGEVLVYYPHIGKTHKDAKTTDYNKASVTVSPVSGGATSTTQAFGGLSKFVGKDRFEADGSYIGRDLPNATFAGLATNSYYTAVIPNTNGMPLTLRVDYTLVATDGSGETINVYGAKAVVPATYTVWQPNYAYTYVFKISDNSNGWTSKTETGAPDGQSGLFPITFDAVVTSFTDANAEQTTVTTVATPSITTYQQGHDWANKDEYSKSQKAGKDTENYKDLYVQVMDNSGATPTLKNDLNGDGKSLLFKITKSDVDYIASEAEVMDALENRTNTPTGSPEAAYKANDPVGRNGITLTKDASHISNTVTEIVNGVDDQPITKIAGTAIASGQVAKIDIDQLAAGTYAYVYCTPPTSEEKVYNVVSATEASTNYAKYYEVALAGDGTDAVKAANSTAAAGKVYFIINKKADGTFDSYTFKQTKVGDDVEGLVEKDIPADHPGSYTSGRFYFDVYYQNDGKYAVKVIKVVN